MKKCYNVSRETFTESTTYENTRLYPKPFFALQLIFAQKIASKTSLSFQDSVLRYSALYRILALDSYSNSIANQLQLKKSLNVSC